MNSEDSKHCKDAMISEYTSLMENNTWELVFPEEDQNVVGSGWVYKVKKTKMDPFIVSGRDSSRKATHRPEERIIKKYFHQSPNIHL